MQEKEQFIVTIKVKLSNMVDTDTASSIINMIILELKNYDLTKKSTELIPYDDENLRIIKLFLSCLIVEGKSKGTIDQYKYSLQRLFNFLKNKKYSEITTADIMAWLASLKISGVKNTTIRNQRSNICSFFTWLYNNHMIEQNPCNSIKPIKVPYEEKKAFSSEEIDTILVTPCIGHSPTSQAEQQSQSERMHKGYLSQMLSTSSTHKEMKDEIRNNQSYQRQLLYPRRGNY